MHDGIVQFGQRSYRLCLDGLKWVWDSATHPAQTLQEGGEYAESVKLYLVNEYDKAYERVLHPLRE